MLNVKTIYLHYIIYHDINVHQRSDVSTEAIPGDAHELIVYSYWYYSYVLRNAEPVYKRHCWRYK